MENRIVSTNRSLPGYTDPLTLLVSLVYDSYVDSTLEKGVGTS